jgi:hypothetical protein
MGAVHSVLTTSTLKKIPFPGSSGVPQPAFGHPRKHLVRIAYETQHKLGVPVIGIGCRQQLWHTEGGCTCGHYFSYAEVPQTRLGLFLPCSRFTQGLFDSFQRNVETVVSLLQTTIRLESRRSPCGSAFEAFIRVLDALNRGPFL